MYTGTVIDDLINIVVRAEQQAREARAEEQQRDAALVREYQQYLFEQKRRERLAGVA